MPDESVAGACIELTCSRQELQTASINYGPGGPTYSCSCGPLSDEEIADLQRAARNGTMVRLIFSDATVVLSDVAIEQALSGWVQLRGRVVAPADWADASRRLRIVDRAAGDSASHTEAVQLLQERYNVAFDNHYRIMVRNAQRAAVTGNPPNREELQREQQAREALNAARAALLATLGPAAATDLDPPL